MKEATILLSPTPQRELEHMQEYKDILRIEREVEEEIEAEREERLKIK